MATPASVIRKELLQLFIVLTATFLIGFIKGHSVAVYGLPGRKAFGKDFWQGAGWGFIMLSATIGLMAAAHSYTPHSVALAGLEILKYGALWAAAFLLVGLAEELAFRGYLQYALTKRIGFWPASIVTCFFFGFAHHNNPGENRVGLANIVLIGLFACLALRRTGSLWFPIGWHTAFDWGESFFYSVPNSGSLLAGHLFNASVTGNHWVTGGTVGPEASVFNVVTTLIGIAVLALVYPEARYPQLSDGASIPVSQTIPKSGATGSTGS
jgi:membrane protease YdiL (CAAX protease family)